MIAALKSQRGALIGEGVTTYLLPRAALFGVRCARLPVLAHLFREREGIFLFYFLHLSHGTIRDNWSSVGFADNFITLERYFR